MNKQLLKEQIRAAIEQNPLREEIQKVSLFGSYAYGVPDEGSDVDILIEFSPGNSIGFFKFFDVKHHLERQLNKKVDLVTPQAISRYLRDEVLSKSETIYERTK